MKTIGHLTRRGSSDGVDYYPTPPHATFALIEKEARHIEKHLVNRPGCIWEPAAGRGWMSMELMRLDYRVISSDIVSPHNPMVPILQHDFLRKPLDIIGEPNVIITNPPYGRGSAQAFAERAISLAPYAAMLCRATWVESMERYDFFANSPPSAIYFFSRRFSCTESYFGTGRENGGMVPYAWFVWDRYRWGESRVDWIDPLVYDRWKENIGA